MKLLITILLLTCCYKLSIAQDTSIAIASIGIFGGSEYSDGDGGESLVLEESAVEGEAETELIYTDLDPAFVDNSPILIDLVNFGTQFVVGMVRETSLTSASGYYNKIYSVEQMTNGTMLYYKLDIQILTNDNVKLHAKVEVSFNSANNVQRVSSFSYEYQNPNNVFVGRNISYNATNSTYNVTYFNGAGEWIEYQQDGLQWSSYSYDLNDYLISFVGYTTSLDNSLIYSNMTIQTSLNLGLQAVGNLAYNNGVWTSYSSISATSLHSIYTYESSSTYLRFDVNFSNGGPNGRVVYVVECPYDGVTQNCENAVLHYYWFVALKGSLQTAYTL